MPAMLSVYHNSIEHANRFCSVVYMIPQNRPKCKFILRFFANFTRFSRKKCIFLHVWYILYHIFAANANLFYVFWEFSESFLEKPSSRS